MRRENREQKQANEILRKASPPFSRAELDRGRLFARRIAGWRASRSMKAGPVLDALELALRARSDTEGLIHHSDRLSQYLAIRYTERLAEAGIRCPVDTTGDSYDNALAESVNGLFKNEVIYPRGPW